jgi:uncharacterized membrane protein
MEHVNIRVAGFTGDASSRSMARGRWQALHEMLVPFPLAYFAGAFVTDLVYWQTTNVMWERFSVWLITAGLIMAGFAIMAVVIDLAAGRQKPAWPRALGYALAVLLSLINVFVHSRDGYTAVVPTGLMFSGLVVVILLATASAGWALTYPHRVGVER